MYKRQVDVLRKANAPIKYVFILIAFFVEGTDVEPVLKRDVVDWP